LIADLGLADVLADAGVAIARARLHLDARPIAVQAFGGAAGGDIRVLSAARVEAALRAAAERASAVRVDGCEATDLESPAAPVTIRTVGPDGERRWRARHLVGCDGAGSWLRGELGVNTPGWPYPRDYWTADFPDEPALAGEALAWLGVDGLVQAMPLPRERRRWLVCRLGRVKAPDADEFRRLVRLRTGVDLPTPLADLRTIRADCARVVTAVAFDCTLAGEAARRLSPLGGQSVSLHWQNAADLADTLLADGALADWDQRAHPRYDAARRRAERLMTAGRPGVAAAWRARLLALVLRSPFADRLPPLGISD
jgi:2-polyprenyl-6-methoxyphenol hydroxylase-like FAD-dependent oxidoreductase